MTPANMRTIIVSVTLALVVTAGCSKSEPSPATQTRPLPSNRFPPGYAPTPPKAAQ
jgi:hypothetical protein